MLTLEVEGISSITLSILIRVAPGGWILRPGLRFREIWDWDGIELVWSFRALVAWIKEPPATFGRSVPYGESTLWSHVTSKYAIPGVQPCGATRNTRAQAPGSSEKLRFTGARRNVSRYRCRGAYS